MKGKLKKGNFHIGLGNSFGGMNLPQGKVVNIVDFQNHPVFGKRYKIERYDEWFEENCFEYVTSQ